MNSRKILTAVAALALVLGCWLLRQPVGRWLTERKISPQVRAFWGCFQATNAAWLNPQPGAITYELVLQRKERDFTTAKSIG